MNKTKQITSIVLSCAALLGNSNNSHAQLNYRLVPIEPKVNKVDQMKPDSTLMSIANDPKSISVKSVEPKVIKQVPLADNFDYFGKKDHAYVIKYTQSYLANHGKMLRNVNNNGKKKFTVIDATLKRHNVPTELRYLAVIESALNPQAVSPVGAVGTWQFMEGTGRMFGLTINGNRDDRTDLSKSSVAAARYLRYLYGQLNDWLLVVAAYNSGPTPVNRAIQRTGSRNFFVIKKYLPRETQGHVMAFIATGTIIEKLKPYMADGKFPANIFNPDAKPEDFIATNEPPKPRFTDEELQSMSIVKFSEPLNLDLIASELRIDKKLLENWNEDYDLFEDKNYSEASYKFRMPKDKVDAFFEKKDLIERRSKAIYAELN